MARQMKDSGVEWIGEIPEKWAVSKVKYFIDCYDGRRVPVDAGERVSGPYPYWGAGSITDYVDKYLFDEELILLGEDGAPFFDPTRPVAFLVNEKIWVNNHIHVLKPHADVYPGYLLHFLNTVDYKTYINGSILNKLTQSNMNSIAFVVPSLREQQSIAAFLDCRCAEIDAVIERTKATIEEYKKLKQAVITEAVTKGVRGPRKMKDSGIEWIGEIPEEWTVSSIKYGVTKVGSGKTPLGGAESYADNGILFLRSQNVHDTGLVLDSPTFITDDVDAEMSNTRVRPGDVLLNITGASIGRCCVFPVEYQRANVNQHVCIIRVIQDTFMSEFMHYYWVSALGHTVIDLYQTGGNREGMSADAIKNAPIIYMSMEEQSQIVSYLDEKCSALDTLIAKKTALLTELETYKKSLIYEYVTGKKEVG